MIGHLKGKVILKTEKFLILETAGVGYKVSVSSDTLSRMPAPRQASGQNETSDLVSFWIHTHVREDALDLYGFLDREELEFFDMLLGVSGIGPRSALAILGIASIEVLRKAISTGDTAYLTKVSGIGRKTAERIVIDLREKVGEDKGSVSLQGELDVLEALKSLGYSQNEAREALKKAPPDMPTNEKIRHSLKILGKK